MKVNISPGRYIVAVSGGVDSMVLLDLLSRQSALDLIVAHVDHGIRPDSEQDRLLVQKRSQELGLPFVYKILRLGSNTSEQRAREARYAFLEEARQANNAQAIMTAHHQDDVIETMLINMHRGTGRRGLSALRSHDSTKRPLLRYTKSELMEYALRQNLDWREDSTNNDERYLRNYLRRQIIPRMSIAARARLINICERMQQVNQDIDDQLKDFAKELATFSDDETVVVRKTFIQLPHEIAEEILTLILKQHCVRNLSRRMIARLATSLKTAQPGTTLDIDKTWQMIISLQTVTIRRK